MSFQISGANSRFPTDDIYKKRILWIKALKETKNKYEKISLRFKIANYDYVIASCGQH